MEPKQLHMRRVFSTIVTTDQTVTVALTKGQIIHVTPPGKKCAAPNEILIFHLTLFIFISAVNMLMLLGVLRSAFFFFFTNK